MASPSLSFVFGWLRLLSFKSFAIANPHERTGFAELAQYARFVRQRREAGTVMLFGADGQIDIGYSSNAQLTAIGTLTEPIIFSSSAASPAAGAWYGIQLWWNNLPNTKFDYCEFNFAGKGSDLRRSAVHATGTSFIASNSKFQSSSGWGIYLDKNCSVTGTGNTFISCALGDIGQDPN